MIVLKKLFIVNFVIIKQTKIIYAKNIFESKKSTKEKIHQI